MAKQGEEPQENTSKGKVGPSHLRSPLFGSKKGGYTGSRGAYIETSSPLLPTTSDANENIWAIKGTLCGFEVFTSVASLVRFSNAE